MAALAVLGIADPSPPPPPQAQHKATGSENKVGADVFGSTTPIAAPSQPQGERWSAADWLAYFDERAAIAEFDGKLDRPAAEALSYKACLAEWLDRNPAASSPEAGCAVCGTMDRRGDDLLPVGLGGGEVWLHVECSAAWRAARIAEAIAGLAALGIASKDAKAQLPGPEVDRGEDRDTTD